MNWLRKLRLRFRALFQKEKLDAGMDDEMRSHIEMQMEENIEAGMKPEEARYAALRQFGWVESIKDTCREQRGVSWIENLGQDLRYGARMLRKNPGFTAVAVLTLALGIGANTAIFTVVNALLLRPLPVRNPEELVQLVTRSGSSELNYDFAYPDYQQLRDGGRTLTGLFAALGVNALDRLILSGQATAQAEIVRGQGVSGNFFQVLGVPAALGRTLIPADDLEGNPQPVAVISHGFWQRRFAADPSVIGKTLSFVGIPFTIVGVAPPSFFGFQPGENPDLWWPLQMIPQIDRDPAGRKLKAGFTSFRIMGRLAPGLARSQAEAELQSVFQRYQDELAAGQARKDSAQSSKVQLRSGQSGWTNLRQQLSRPLTLLMGAVGIVLLIACANVASLLLARAAARAREFSVRSALGATRRRLMRQSLTEILLLASLGGILGLLFAQGGTRLLLAFVQLQSNATSFNIAPDVPVLLFTAGLCLLTGFLLGAVPALRSSNVDVASTLKGSAGTLAGNASGHRWLQSLVVAQVALSLVLLVGAGLFVRTLKNLLGDTGFKRNNVVQFSPATSERPSAARMSALIKEIVARLEASPGIQTASFYLFGVLSGNGYTQKVSPEGYTVQPDQDLQCKGVFTGPRFFETLGIEIISGRDINAQDELSAEVTNSAARRVAVVNQSMARRYFGNVDPLGKRFYIQDQPEKKFEIVGVVRDVKYRSLREGFTPTFYLPYFQESRSGPISFVLRTSGDPRPTMAGLRLVVGQIDPSISVQNVQTMNEVVNDSVRQERIVAQLGGLFSIFALALACLGLYGVLSFAVVQRTREIAVRVALGAQNRNVLALVLSEGAKLVLMGSVIGLACAFVATRFVTSLLYGVSGTDPINMVSVSLLLLLMAMLASWLPARRAAKVDPMVSLRYE
jgi:predicted permease